jgi:LacI family transcriptional regulator
MYERPDELEQVQRELRSRACRFVYVGWDDVKQPIQQVFYDNKIAGYQAAQHLFECGHTKITFFSPVDGQWVDERLDYARRAALDAGLGADIVTRFPVDHLVHEYTDHVALGYQKAVKGFAEGVFEDAIISANDRLAVGLMKAAEETGKKPGVDFSVIGFDDAPIARILGLSSMRPPLESLGTEAARLVERSITADTAPIQVRLSSHLVLRSSTMSKQRNF